MLDFTSLMVHGEMDRLVAYAKAVEMIKDILSYKKGIVSTGGGGSRIS